MTAITLTQSISFDGLNDYATAGTHITLRPSSAFTLAAWYFTTETGNRALISWARSTAPWYSLYLGIDSSIFNNGSALQYSVLSGAAIPASWTHAAATWDGSVHRYYRDGVLHGSSPASGPIAYGITECLVGNWWSGSPTDFSNFSGLITDPRIYGRALSLSEIRQICSGIEPDTTARLGYWPLTEPSGAFANSGSAASSSLSLMNGAGRNASLPTFLSFSGNSRRRRQSVSGGVL